VCTDTAHATLRYRLRGKLECAKRNTTKEIIRRFAKLGFPHLRLHDLRGADETLLLDSGMPVHVVAAHGAHDPATCCGITRSGQLDIVCRISFRATAAFSWGQPTLSRGIGGRSDRGKV
jgi:hypothetical protein